MAASEKPVTAGRPAHRSRPRPKPGRGESGNAEGFGKPPGRIAEPVTRPGGSPSRRSSVLGLGSFGVDDMPAGRGLSSSCGQPPGRSDGVDGVAGGPREDKAEAPPHGPAMNGPGPAADGPGPTRSACGSIRTRRSPRAAWFGHLRRHVSPSRRHAGSRGPATNPAVTKPWSASGTRRRGGPGDWRWIMSNAARRSACRWPGSGRPARPGPDGPPSGHDRRGGAWPRCRGFPAKALGGCRSRQGGAQMFLAPETGLGIAAPRAGAGRRVGLISGRGARPGRAAGGRHPPVCRLPSAGSAPSRPRAFASGLSTGT